jgi:hypothetical protein
MPTVQVEAQVSSEELLKAVGQLKHRDRARIQSLQVYSEEFLTAIGQLKLPDLERFVSQVIALQAQRKAPVLPQAEAELLLRINQGIPADIQKRYDELIVKRRAETLTPDEHIELLRLTEKVEKIEAQRMKYLAELARLRRTSLTVLMKKLGIRTPAYA